MALATAVPALGTAYEAATAGDTLPRWFTSALYAVVVWIATAGVSGLLMLSVSMYSAMICAAIATVVAGAVWPFRPRPRVGSRVAHGPAAGAVAIAAVLLVLAGVFASEHLITNRDPSVYINTGRSIARTHRIHPEIAKSPFDDTRVFARQLTGFKVTDHRLTSNFLNFLPVLLALGWSVGGDGGLLLVPAVLGALALLTLYALATTVVGPRWALLGPALLTLAPLQSWFARDAYAELPLEILVLAGLWLVIEARRNGDMIAGGLAGVVMGAGVFVRIDALAILVAIPVVIAVETLRANALEPDVCRQRRRVFRWFGICVALAGAAGLYVSRRQSPNYVKALADNLRTLELALGASVVVALGILVVHRFRGGVGRRLAGSNLFVALLAALTVAGAVYAYKFRPHSGAVPQVPSPTMAPAAREALYQYLYSASFRWFAWYLGTATLAFAVIGFVVLGIRAARSDSPAFLLLAAATPVTLLYIARPSITPDHLWAMRRYLPITLPALTIAAAAGAIWLASLAGALQRRLRAPLTIVFVASMVIPAGRSGLPLIRAQMQGGALDAVHRICRVAGPDAAIVVAAGGFLNTELPQTLRGFCGVPAAGLKPDVITSLAVYARQWKAEGRQLYLVTGRDGPDPDALSTLTLRTQIDIPDARDPERALGRPARKYAPKSVGLSLYRVTPI